MQLKFKTKIWKIGISWLNHAMWHVIWNNANKKMDYHIEYRKGYLLCLFQFQLLCMNRTFSVFRNISQFLKLYFSFIHQQNAIFHQRSVKANKPTAMAVQAH